MRIEKITEDAIVFDNGKVIDYFHSQDCCENNYADFKQLDDLGRDYDFDENLKYVFYPMLFRTKWILFR